MRPDTEAQNTVLDYYSEEDWMRFIVCGGRDFDNYEQLSEKLQNLVQTPMLYYDYGYGEITVIHGGARGADSLADRWAKEKGCRVRVYPAEWDKHGKSAGPIRNNTMLEDGNPDFVVAFPGGRGTQHMVRIAVNAGLTVYTLKGQINKYHDDGI